MSTAFKPYEEYKRTEYDWINEVPCHWREVPIRAITEVSSERNGNRNDLELLSVYREYGVIKKASREDNHNVESQDLSNYKFVDKGYLVLNKMKMWQGSLGVSIYRGIVSPAYIVCKLVGDFNYSYIHYLLRSPGFKTIYNRISYGVRVGQWDMRYDDFKNIKLYIPPKEEQDQIVRYLDSSIAKINKFIKTKKKLIEVLKEYKQAVINEAVTRGLDPNVRTKQSGVPWLGNIPEHWNLVRAKNLVRYKHTVVGHKSADYRLLSLTTNGVIFRDLENAKGKFPSDFSTYQEVNPGDIIFCLFDVDETPRTVGLSEIKGMITGAYDVCEHIGVNSDIRYLYYYYLSIDDKKAFKPIYTGLRKVIPKDLFMQLKTPQPPIAEQQVIVRYIEQKTKAIDKVITSTQKELDLISEYRTRLISDVVTGKIDVRGMAVDDFNEELEEIEEMIEDELGGEEGDLDAN